MEIKNELINTIKIDIIENITYNIGKIEQHNTDIINKFEEEKHVYEGKITEMEQRIADLILLCRNKDDSITELNHDLENMNKFSYTKQLAKLLSEEKRNSEIASKKYNFLLKQNEKLKKKIMDFSKTSNNILDKSGEKKIEVSGDLIEEKTEKNVNGNILDENEEENKTIVNEKTTVLDEDEDEGFNLFEYNGKEYFLKVENGKQTIYKKNKQNQPGEVLGFMKNGKIYKKKKKSKKL